MISYEEAKTHLKELESYIKDNKDLYKLYSRDNLGTRTRKANLRLKVLRQELNLIQTIILLHKSRRKMYHKIKHRKDQMKIGDNVLYTSKHTFQYGGEDYSVDYENMTLGKKYLILDIKDDNLKLQNDGEFIGYYPKESFKL